VIKDAGFAKALAEKAEYTARKKRKLIAEKSKDETKSMAY
jgi:hypothetical protein